MRDFIAQIWCLRPDVGSRIAAVLSVFAIAMTIAHGSSDAGAPPDIDRALAVMRSIETRAVGFETRFRFLVENRDSDGEDMLRYETVATWRVDRDRVAGEEVPQGEAPNLIVKRWWTGSEFVKLPLSRETLEPAGPMQVSWYFHASLPSFAAVFNHCAGYHHSSQTGLPMAVALADNVKVETTEERMVVRYASGESPRFTLTIDLLPEPRYQSWVMELRRADGDGWHEYARYHVEEWMECRTLSLPQRAVCVFNAPRPDGSIARGKHVFERLDARIVDDRETVDAWFDIPYIVGTRVVNRASGIQWTVGQSTLIVDDLAYDIGQPIWTDPTAKIAELLAEVSKSR